MTFCGSRFNLCSYGPAFRASEWKWSIRGYVSLCPHGASPTDLSGNRVVSSPPCRGLLTSVYLSFLPTFSKHFIQTGIEIILITTSKPVVSTRDHGTFQKEQQFFVPGSYRWLDAWVRALMSTCRPVCRCVFTCLWPGVHSPLYVYVHLSPGDVWACVCALWARAGTITLCRLTKLLPLLLTSRQDAWCPWNARQSYSGAVAHTDQSCTVIPEIENSGNLFITLYCEILPRLSETIAMDHNIEPHCLCARQMDQWTRTCGFTAAVKTHTHSTKNTMVPKSITQQTYSKKKRLAISEHFN